MYKKLLVLLLLAPVMLFAQPLDISLFKNMKPAILGRQV
jgi:hypothetical protein